MKHYRVTTAFFFGEKFIKIGEILSDDVIKNNADLISFVEEVAESSDDDDEPAEEGPAPEVIEATLETEEPAVAQAVKMADVVDEATEEEVEVVEEEPAPEVVETISDEERVMKLEAILTLEEVLEAKKHTDGNNLERIESEGITEEMLRRVAPTGKGGGFLKADLEKLLGRDI